MDVFAMALVIFRITNAMIGKALLPDQRLPRQFLLNAERESAFDVLKSFFQGDIFRRRNNQVEVVRHNHELVPLETAFCSVVLKDVEDQARHCFFLKQGTASMRDGREKERADFLRSMAHRSPALKRVILNHPYAALKGRSFTTKTQRSESGDNCAKTNSSVE